MIFIIIIIIIIIINKITLQISTLSLTRQNHPSSNFMRRTCLYDITLCATHSSISWSLMLVRPCLWLLPLIVPTFLASIFHTTLSLLFWCLLLYLLSPSLFSCSRYTLWDTHIVHGIPVPSTRIVHAKRSLVFWFTFFSKNTFIFFTTILKIFFSNLRS